jgi:hypothetical protein
MSNALLTPRKRSTALDLANGRLWRTQLLPLGEINYKGRKVRFDKDYLLNLVNAFRENVFGQVPFQLATGDNKHTNDPERYRGKIVDLVLTGDGLDVLLQPTEDGEALLRKNPELGVSARIYESYERADGKSWPAALQHVLGTLDPRVPGMRTWKEVEVPVALSNEIGEVEVVDLSDVTFGEREGGTDKVAFSKEDRTQLIELLKKVRDGGVKDEDLEGLVDELGDEVDDETELTDEELDQLIASAEADQGESDDDDEGEEEDEEGDLDEPALGRAPATVAASNGRRRGALELANARNAELGERLDLVQATLDDQAFTNEKRVLSKDYGIPPKVVDLARPLLEGSGHVVELAGGDEIDAGSVMRRVLMELGKQIKLLDLSEQIGSGLQPDEDREEEEKARKETADFVTSARETFGL